MKFESSPPSRSEDKESPKKSNGVSRREFLKLIGKAALGAAVAGGLADKAAEAFDKSEKKEDREQYYNDWQELKRVVDESGIEVNIKYLQDKLGHAPQFKAFLYKPLFMDLQLVKEIKRREADGEDLTKTEGGMYLLKKASETYQRFWNGEAIGIRLRDREAKEDLSTSFEGFEALPGSSNKTVQVLLESRFDRRWLYGNISKFIYIDQPAKRAHYDVAATAEGRGIQSVLTKGERQVVNIYRSQWESDYQFLRIMAHEVGHHQDWENNNRLPIHERFIFLKEVTEGFEKRFEAKKPFWNQYIDKIIPEEYYYNKAYPHETIYRQVMEYWAVLMDWYTLDQDGLRLMFPQEYALAKKWYKKIIEY